MNIRALLLAGGACVMLISGPAWAQASGTPTPTPSPAAPQAVEPADADPNSSGDIVITAQRRSERLQNVPIAVTALTGEALTTGGLTQSLDIGKVAPSVVSTQASGFYTPYIRGVGSRAITPGNESPVATYIDGVYQTDKQGLLVSGFNDVASIQVLRGPQGTLFGRNATGGAILITTKGPSTTWTGNFEATGGNAEVGGKAFLAGPLAPTLSFSVAGFYRKEFDYIRNLNPNNGGGSKIGGTFSYGFRGKILWQPTDELSVLAEANVSLGRDEGPWAPQAIAGTGLTAGEATARARNITIPDIRNQSPVYAGEVVPYIQARGAGQILTINYETKDFSLKSITSHRRDFSSGFLDLDATPLPLFYFRTDLASNVWQQELTLGSAGDRKLSWLGGAYLLYYRDGYRNLDQNVGVPFPYNPATFGSLPSGATHIDYHSTVITKSLGLFGEVKYKFGPSTSLTLGARYTTETQTLDSDNNQVVSIPNGTGGITTLAPTRTAAICAATPTCKGLSTTFRKPTFRAVLTHDFAPGIMAYLSYNRGFKSGVYNNSSINAIVATQPETVDAYELGFKSELFDRKLTFNASVYRNDYNNLQVQVTNLATNTQITLNAAAARISGIEIELGLRPAPGLTLNAAFSTFFEAKYTSFPNCSLLVQTGAGNSPVTGDCTGKRLPGTPTSASIRGEYKLPLGDGNSLAFNGLFSYQSSYDFVQFASAATRAPRQEAIYTINLSTTLKLKNGLRLTAWGRDLANQKHVFRGLFATAFGYETTFARGATFGGTVGFDF